MSTQTVWPVLRYDDARAAIRFLVDAFGFEEVMAVPPGDGPVEHAELRWPGGGVMLGSVGVGKEPFRSLANDVSSVYVVTDAPDELFDRATKAGAEEVLPLVDEDFGSRGFTVRDPEGNLWSFGTYAGG